MPRPLLLSALALFVAALLAACGSSGPSAEEVQELAPDVPLQPEDISAVAEGSWTVQSEGPVAGDAYGELSNGLPEASLADAAVEPIAAYQSTVAGEGEPPLLDASFPHLAYSAVLLFDSAGDAEAAFDAAEALARDTDWLASSPAAEGVTTRGQEVDEPILALAETVDQLVWLHISALTGDGGVVTDDILLVRDGELWAMLRAVGAFDGENREASIALFESALVIPVVRRLHEAVS